MEATQKKHMTRFFKYYMCVTLVSNSVDIIKPSADNAGIAGTITS